MRAAAAERGIRTVLDEIVADEVAAEADTRPELLGEVYQALLTPDDRRRSGIFYTPAALAAEVADATLGPLLDRGVPADRIQVCDPAVGGGSLLLAAARLLIRHGADPAHIVEHQLAGIDLDPIAVEVARAALTLLGGASRRLVVGDGLGEPPWAKGFDAVLTNPPFLNQLRTATVRAKRAGVDLWDGAAKGYADTANLFLLLSVELVKPGGRVGIILPEPILSARDAAPTRERVGQTTTLDRLWRPGLGAFDAGVRVVVAILQTTETTETTETTAAAVAVAAAAATATASDAWQCGDWAVLADSDVPHVQLESAGEVGDDATVTADFRDQYYGVAAIAADDDDGARTRLVTCGLIDPARIGWGHRTARVAKTRMLHPSIDVNRLTPSLQRWATARLVPKVMLATQTRILEAAADETGCWLPVVPVITIVPARERLWHTLAALNAPPLAAHAHRAHTGAALSADAIKLSAKQVARLPLPAGHTHWDRGAGWAHRATKAEDDEERHAALITMGEAMCDAYGVAREPLMGWWSARLRT